MGRVDEVLARGGARRVLAVDGGGVRGLVALEVLARLEAELRTALRRPGLVLADTFDLVVGTSTGALVAACLAWGLPVSAVRELFLGHAREVFRPAPLWTRLFHRYRGDGLARALDGLFGDATLGDPRVRTLLGLVLRNATTDAPWPLSNAPGARYNDRRRADCGLGLPLAALVRASCAAPTYFPPVRLALGARDFLFVDGGVTAYNNPAFLAFLLATLPEYGVGWPAGEERLLLVSVGTGRARAAEPRLAERDLHLLHSARSVPHALMGAAALEQDLACRVLGRCRHGPPLDRELGSLLGGAGPLGERAFAYVRYDADLSRAGLEALGLGDLDPAPLRALDATRHLDALVQVGRAVAARQVRREHLAGFLPAEPSAPAAAGRPEAA